MQKKARFGTLAYLAIFIWSLALVLLASPERMLPAAGFCLLIAGLMYPSAFRRLLQVRWLIFTGVLIVVNALWIGDSDRLVLGVPVSSQGLAIGLQMALRALVVLVVVDGFSSSVSVSEVAGLLERVGLQGLGFSLGVAINLLPSLRQSGTNAWHSLRMRGGLRHKRWRGLQLLMVTVISNALRRAEEIALAAEARAFSPERAHVLPLKPGSLDRLVVLAALLSGIFILWVG